MTLPNFDDILTTEREELRRERRTKKLLYLGGVGLVVGAVVAVTAVLTHHTTPEDRFKSEYSTTFPDSAQSPEDALEDAKELCMNPPVVRAGGWATAAGNDTTGDVAKLSVIVERYCKEVNGE